MWGVRGVRRVPRYRAAMSELIRIGKSFCSSKPVRPRSCTTLSWSVSYFASSAAARSYGSVSGSDSRITWEEAGAGGADRGSLFFPPADTSR